MFLFKKRASIALIQRIDDEDCVLIGTKGLNNEWELPTTDKQYGEPFLFAGLRVLHYQAGVRNIQLTRRLIRRYRHRTLLTKHYTFFIYVIKDDYTFSPNLSSNGWTYKWEAVRDAVTYNLSKNSKRALLYFLRVLKRKNY